MTNLNYLTSKICQKSQVRGKLLMRKDQLLTTLMRVRVHILFRRKSFVLSDPDKQNTGGLVKINFFRSSELGQVVEIMKEISGGDKQKTRTLFVPRTCKNQFIPKLGLALIFIAPIAYTFIHIYKSKSKYFGKRQVPLNEFPVITLPHFLI